MSRSSSTNRSANHAPLPTDDLFYLSASPHSNPFDPHNRDLNNLYPQLSPATDLFADIGSWADDSFGLGDNNYDDLLLPQTSLCYPSSAFECSHQDAAEETGYLLAEASAATPTDPDASGTIPDEAACAQKQVKDDVIYGTEKEWLEAVYSRPDSVFQSATGTSCMNSQQTAGSHTEPTTASMKNSGSTTSDFPEVSVEAPAVSRPSRPNFASLDNPGALLRRLYIEERNTMKQVINILARDYDDVPS